MLRHRFSILTLIALAVVVSSDRRVVIAAGPIQSHLCLDAKGGKYSGGAMIRVKDQVQLCAEGRWTFSPDFPQPDNVIALVNGKSCRSTAENDRDQEYASGLLHPVGDNYERCEDGKWAKMGIPN